LRAAPSERDHVRDADALWFGQPELKAYIDSLGGLWVQGKSNGKAGAVFCSTSTPHGGNESTLLSMYNPLAHLGFIIVPAGYADASLYKAGTPYGASSISNNQATPPSADDLDKGPPGDRCRQGVETFRGKVKASFMPRSAH